MDIFTLTVLQSLANGIQVAALYGQYRTDRTHPGPNWWTLGSACIALGFVCNTLQHISGFGSVAIVANNALFFSGLALLYVGVLRFFGQRERQGRIQLSGTVFFLLTAYLTFAGNDLVARHILVSSAVAILSFLIARALYVHTIRSVTTSAYFLAIVFAAHGFFFVLRTIVLLTGHSVSDTLMQTATYLVTFVASTLWTFGFIIMVNQRLNAEIRKNEEKYLVLFMDSPDAYLIIADGVFVDCNRATENMLRGNRAQIVGHPPELLSPEFQPDGRKSSESAGEKISEALETGGKTFEWVHRRLDGEDFYVEVSIASMMLNEKSALFTTWRDITERKKVEHALARSEIKFRTLFDFTSEAVMLLNETGFFDCNKAALEMFGCTTQEEVCSTHPGKLSPPYQPCGTDSLTLANSHITATLERGNHRFEWLHQRADNGKVFPAEVLLCAIELDGSSVIQATVRDITERKQVEKTLEDSNRKLETLSITDGLTGIANRRHFDTVLAREHARHARSGGELALILLDIDHFKSFNDTYGHIKGDECLRQIGRVLSECAVRPADLAARYGGEEFACILPETDLGGAITIAERIRYRIMTLAVPHRGSSSAECVTASLGVASVQCTADNTAEEILGQVDKLLYRAKSSGRNRVEFDATSDAKSLPGGTIKGNFMQLAWKDSFRCGNHVIDSQHQGLFHIANELFEAVLSGRTATEVSDVITRLLDETGRHFHDEEMILKTVGFSGIDQHRAEHATLLAKGSELSQQFNAGGLTVGDVFQFLAHDVVMVHMLGADREYFPFVSDAEITAKEVVT